MDSRTKNSAVANFCASFVNELRKDKNVVSSPLSAEFVLALLTLGTTEPAHSELLSALGFSDDDSIRSTFSDMSAKLRRLEGVVLNVANKIYINEGNYELQPEIENDAVEVFDAACEKINFSDSANSASTINGWVEKKTNDKIKDLFTADSFDESTRLVLVNAIYFQGSWKIPFRTTSTKDRPFHINANTTIQVPTMYSNDKHGYGYSEFLQAKLIKLQYLGEKAGLLIVLPNEIEGLNEVMKKLADGYDLIPDVEKMKKPNGVLSVIITVPKFKIESTINLKQILPKLGIKTIFNRNSSGITKLLNNGESLHVSSALQKAFIDVNELGTEAAVATKMQIRCKKGPPEIYADHPFLYLLLDNYQTPLFIGAYRGVA